MNIIYLIAGLAACLSGGVFLSWAIESWKNRYGAVALLGSLFFGIGLPVAGFFLILHAIQGGLF